MITLLFNLLSEVNVLMMIHHTRSAPAQIINVILLHARYTTEIPRLNRICCYAIPTLILRFVLAIRYNVAKWPYCVISLLDNYSHFFSNVLNVSKQCFTTLFWLRLS